MPLDSRDITVKEDVQTFSYTSHERPNCIDYYYGYALYKHVVFFLCLRCFQLFRIKQTKRRREPLTKIHKLMEDIFGDKSVIVYLFVFFFSRSYRFFR